MFLTNTFDIELTEATLMPANSKDSGNTLALATPCDFSKFEIDDDLKRQLEQVGSFGCDTIWYDEVQKTMTSGHVDGYRWLFAVMGRQWFFLVFRRGDERSVQWQNSKQLSFEESWDISDELESDS
ncbi:hypothetical protein EV561_13822 [Rhizobium sp. BK376]|nr:hypothetical protein EV561_13822 [Rhizobium sp. BK376]